jgi:putative folate metabolism gamma-glutamate ligase
MHITPLKSPKVYPNNSMESLLDQTVKDLQERDIIAITSKVISLCEGSIVAKAEVLDKKALIHQEADAYIHDDIMISKYGIYLTLKNGFLIPTAGIDESNSEDSYILYPKDIPASTARIWQYLRHKFNLSNLGVLITDSTTSPLRYGVTGIGIGWCGFEPLYSYIGKPDCFGKPLRMTKINLLDALAASAVYVMGEGNEQTPMAVIRDAPHITFTSSPPDQNMLDSVRIEPENDLYAPLLTAVPWIKKD